MKIIANENYAEIICTQDEKSLAKSIISSMINDCKIQYMSQWEKDHSTSREQYDKNIEILREILGEINSSKEDISLTLKIEL